MANKKAEIQVVVQTAQAGQNLDTIDKKVKGLGKTADNTERTVSKGFRGIGTSAVAMGTIAGNVITQMTGGLKNMAASVVSTGAAFEQQMARVGALTQATSSEFTMLAETARTLGATTVFSASEVADGMGFLAMAGFNTNEIVSAMPGLLAQAAAGQIDLGRASDITSNVLSGFNIAASESGRVADVLTRASISSNTTIESLGDSMKFVAPVAASLGLSMEELAAATGIMGDAGIQGSLAGTALRASLLALATPSSTQAALMRDLNFELERSDGSTKSLAEIVQSLETSTRNMTDAQRTATLGLLVGNEAASGFTALIARGSGELRAFTEELENAGGTAERVAGQQMNTFSGTIKLLESALDDLSITLFSTFDTELRAVIEEGIRLISRFKNDLAGLLRFVVVNGGVAFDAFQEIVRIVFNNFGTILYNTLSGIPELVRIALSTAGDSFRLFVGFVRDQFTNLKDLFVGIGDVLIGAFTLDRERFNEGLEGIKSAMLEGVTDMIDLGTEIGSEFGQAFADAAAVMFAGVDTTELERIVSQFITLQQATAQAAAGGVGAGGTDAAPAQDPKLQQIEAAAMAETALTETTEEMIARRIKAAELENEFRGKAMASDIEMMELQQKAREATTEAYAQSIQQTIMSDQISIKSGKDMANSIIGNVTGIIKAKLAESIAKMLASLPFPSNILLGGVAAAGISAVFDKLVPKFNTGTRGFAGGLAIVGDDPRNGGSGELVSMPRGTDVYTRQDTRNILNNLSKPAPSPAGDRDAINRQTEVLGAHLQALGDRISTIDARVSLYDLDSELTRYRRSRRATGNTAG